MKLKELVRTFNLGDIALIRSLLDSERIVYLAHGEHFNLVRPLVQPVRFLVAEDDLDRARPLIEPLQLTFVPIANLCAGEEDPSEGP